MQSHVGAPPHACSLGPALEPTSGSRANCRAYRAHLSGVPDGIAVRALDDCFRPLAEYCPALVIIGGTWCS